MAERRMFAKTIVTSDAFLDMPLSARCLYFTFGMFADDDGFVNSPKSIMRQVGASMDDMRILIAKKFIIEFEDGVIVIKHWRINNYLRNDRYIETKYKDHRASLALDENGAYTTICENQFEVIEQPKQLSDARKRRADAIKNSTLPYSFIYKIRNAFVGEMCPICGCKMGVLTDSSDPSHIPNPRPSIQHNTPISLGGLHEIDNISVICEKCNASIRDTPTGSLNNELVQQKWKEICAVEGMDTEVSKGKSREGKDSEGKDKTTTTTTSSTPAHAKDREPPSRCEVFKYFKDELCVPLSDIESEKFWTWNELRGWDCLPKWKTAAELWVARMEEREG